MPHQGAKTIIVDSKFVKQNLNKLCDHNRLDIIVYIKCQYHNLSYEPFLFHLMMSFVLVHTELQSDAEFCECFPAWLSRLAGLLATFGCSEI